MTRWDTASVANCFEALHTSNVGRQSKESNIGQLTRPGGTRAFCSDLCLPRFSEAAQDPARSLPRIAGTWVSRQKSFMKGEPSSPKSKRTNDGRAGGDRLAAAQDPIRGFRGQALERLDGELEVFLPGILDLVVANAAER